MNGFHPQKQTNHTLPLIFVFFTIILSRDSFKIS